VSGQRSFLRTEAASFSFSQAKALLAGCVAGTHQPRFVREHDCLDAVAQAEFSEQTRDVSLDGGLADDERVRDLPVRQALRDELVDLEFAGGQFAESGRQLPVGRSGGRGSSG